LFQNFSIGIYVATLLVLDNSIYLFEPEAFHAENYKESPNNVGVSFINKKAHQGVASGE